jgi:hypothetical protein
MLTQTPRPLCSPVLFEPKPVYTVAPRFMQHGNLGNASDVANTCCPMHMWVAWQAGAHSSAGESTILLSCDQLNGAVDLLLKLGPAMPAGQPSCQAGTSSAGSSSASRLTCNRVSNLHISLGAGQPACQAGMY